MCYLAPQLSRSTKRLDALATIVSLPKCRTGAAQAPGSHRNQSNQAPQRVTAAAPSPEQSTQPSDTWSSCRRSSRCGHAGRRVGQAHRGCQSPPARPARDRVHRYLPQHVQGGPYIITRRSTVRRWTAPGPRSKSLLRFLTKRYAWTTRPYSEVPATGCRLRGANRWPGMRCRGFPGRGLEQLPQRTGAGTGAPGGSHGTSLTYFADLEASFTQQLTRHFSVQADWLTFLLR